MALRSLISASTLVLLPGVLLPGVLLAGVLLAGTTLAFASPTEGTQNVERAGAGITLAAATGMEFPIIAHRRDENSMPPAAASQAGPETFSLALLGAGLVGAGLIARRRLG